MRIAARGSVPSARRSASNPEAEAIAGCGGCCATVPNTTTRSASASPTPAADAAARRSAGRWSSPCVRAAAHAITGATTAYSLAHIARNETASTAPRAAPADVPRRPPPAIQSSPTAAITSARPMTFATASTCTGCMANRSPTSRAPAAGSHRSASHVTSAVAAACQSRFSR